MLKINKVIILSKRAWLVINPWLITSQALILILIKMGNLTVPEKGSFFLTKNSVLWFEKWNSHKLKTMKKLNTLFLAAFILVFSSVSIAQTFDGYALYNDGGENNAYLIDENGAIVHTWNCAETANYATLLKDNGNIIRGAEINNTTFYIFLHTNSVRIKVFFAF